MESTAIGPNLYVRVGKGKARCLSVDPAALELSQAQNLARAEAWIAESIEREARMTEKRRRMYGGQE